MSKAPRISVILPVYNAGDYLRVSIDSILAQTFTDYELIIINDGSKDHSEAIIKSYTDPRIRYLSQPNSGLAATLNKGIELSRASIIARQDQDDISLPERFAKQLHYLEQHPEIVLLGTRASIFTDDGKIYGKHDHATDPGLLAFDLMFDNPFVHSSVMFRKNILERTGVYTTDKNYYEDYNLWSRMAENGKVANLRDMLVEYRHHEKSLSKGGSYFAKNALYLQSTRNITNLLGRTDQAANDLMALIHFEYTMYRGSSPAACKKALEGIAEAILVKHPGSEALVRERLKQYKRIVSYFFYIYWADQSQRNKLKLLWLRIYYVLSGAMPHIKND